MSFELRKGLEIVVLWGELKEQLKKQGVGFDEISDEFCFGDDNDVIKLEFVFLVSQRTIMVEIETKDEGKNKVYKIPS